MITTLRRQLDSLKVGKLGLLSTLSHSVTLCGCGRAVDGVPLDERIHVGFNVDWTLK